MREPDDELAPPTDEDFANATRWSFQPLGAGAVAVSIEEDEGERPVGIAKDLESAMHQAIFGAEGESDRPADR
jgi:hypothetical protein